jgi:quercetin dioxygenase-like cupin family protein
VRRLLGRLLTAGLAAQQLERGDSIMLFEETAPVGTDTTFHLHRDSDEVGYVLSGEITFKIGEEVTVGGPGTCAFIPRGVPHAWKCRFRDTQIVLFHYQRVIKRPPIFARPCNLLAYLHFRMPS